MGYLASYKHVFYQFYQPPIFFNETVANEIRKSESAESFAQLESDYTEVFNEKKTAVGALASEDCIVELIVPAATQQNRYVNSGT